MSELQLRAVVADRQLDVEFSVSAGEVLAVLGPNGAGKSTALHVIAGLVRPDEGVVRLGERVLTDTAAGVNVATHDRRVGLLLQDPLLFPHHERGRQRGLRAAQSSQTVPVSGRARDRERRRCAGCARWTPSSSPTASRGSCPAVRLSGSRSRGRWRPTRCAVARRAADRARRRRGRGRSARCCAVWSRRSGCAVILITHDLLDVFTLADRVLVLESGKIAEIGPVAEVLAAPRSHFGARIAGVNLVNGTIGADGALHARSGRPLARHGFRGRCRAHRRAGCHRGVPADGGGRVSRPAARQPAQLHRADRCGAGHPRIRGLGARQEQPDGAPGLAAEITVDAASELRLTPGDRCGSASKRTKWRCIRRRRRLTPRLR